MQRTMRLRPVLAALAAIFAGLTLATSAVAVAGGDSASQVMPSGGCPPAC
jgi:hypothetical protein